VAKRDKRLAEIRHNPHKVDPDTLDLVLRAAGFVSKHEGTSHKQYTKGARRLTVPQRKPLRRVYVEQALDLLDELAEQEQSDDDSGT